MTTATQPAGAGTVTSKEAHRNWKTVTDKALRAPVVITAHGRPRHVLMAYEDYQRLRAQTRTAYLTRELPPELADELLEDLAKPRVPSGTLDDGDTIID